MYTQCPHCQTCFRVSEAHLKAAGGRVRCGSCQEVFDATQSLYNNLTDKQPVQSPVRTAPTPDKAAVPTRKTRPVTPTKPAAPQRTRDTQVRDRKTIPDQTPFMQSVIDSDRYNNLDDMGSISIPGDLNFGDSIIKSPPEEPSSAQTTETEAEHSNPYEDIESKEVPTSDADRASIQSLFAAADSQILEGEEKSQLDRDIEELLAFAENIDLDSVPDVTPTSAVDKQRARDTDEFDLDAIAAFEKEIAAEYPTAQDSATPQAPEEIQAEHAPDAALETDARDSMVEEELPSADEEIPRALRRSLDSLNAAPPRSAVKTLGLLGLIILLLGALGFQLVLFRNVELVKLWPSLTPAIASACDHLPCQYSGKTDVSQVKLLNRDVRSHPTQKNALLISAAFVNEAVFDQPYPSILITLSDLSGNVVASRQFTPQDYLEDMYNRFILLESGTPVHVTLAVLDPGSDAINFEFSFL